MAIAIEQMKKNFKPGETLRLPSPFAPGTTKTTYLLIAPDGQTYTKEYLDGLDLPLKNIQEEIDPPTKTLNFVGEFAHPGEDYWWKYLETYKSGYCGTSLIVPFWDTANPFNIHFVILYALSIVVRYLPSLWHEIEDGKLNHIRALIEHYLVVVDNVLPQLVLERITGDRLAVHHPGTLSAPA